MIFDLYIYSYLYICLRHKYKTNVYISQVWSIDLSICMGGSHARLGFRRGQRRRVKSVMNNGSCFLQPLYRYMFLFSFVGLCISNYLTLCMCGMRIWRSILLKCFSARDRNCARKSLLTFLNNLFFLFLYIMHFQFSGLR